MRLDGRTAVVTGASQGIGRAIAVALATEGAAVVAGARNLERLEEMARSTAGKIVPAVCDVRKEEDVQALVELAMDRFGRLDVLCNNAGSLTSALLVDTSREAWDETMEINARGVFFGCKHAIPAMRASSDDTRGSIINVASINSFVGEKMSSAYVASKAAVLLLTKTAAAEVAEYGIRVNALCPGGTETAMMDDYFDAMGSRDAAEELMRKYQPLSSLSGGMVRPEQIADGAVFLASDESSAITGTSIVIDGGLLASWDH